MARNTSVSERNELTIHDNMSDSDIVLYYRTPTTAERQGYANLSVTRKGRKIKFNTAAARLKYGLRILAGFREGDFERNVDGRKDLYSSDKGSPRYLATWKDELEAGASDLVMLLAAHVFDASAEIDEEGQDDQQDEDGGDDADPNSEKTSQL